MLKAQGPMVNAQRQRILWRNDTILTPCAFIVAEVPVRSSTESLGLASWRLGRHRRAKPEA
jgi:hypothetical protein